MMDHGPISNFNWFSGLTVIYVEDRVMKKNEAVSVNTNYIKHFADIMTIGIYVSSRLYGSYLHIIMKITLCDGFKSIIISSAIYQFRQTSTGIRSTRSK